MMLFYSWTFLVGLCVFTANIAEVKCLESDEESERQEFSAKAIQDSSIPWIDLAMKLDNNGSLPDKISELNLEFHFDDGDTPPSKMTILEPNITQSGKFTIDKQLMEEHANSTSSVMTMNSTSNNNQQEEEHSCPNIEEIVEELTKRKFMLKGEKGDPGQIPQNLVNLDLSQLKGERGPPGHCSPSDCSSTAGDPLMQSGWPPFPQPTPSHRYPVPPKHLYKIVPGALVFPTRRAMLQMREFSFVGTVAFVETDQIFYGRVENGWRSFMMGSHVHRSLAPPTRPTIPETPTPTVNLQEQAQRLPAAPATSTKPMGDEAVAQRTMFPSFPVNDDPVQNPWNSESPNSEHAKHYFATASKEKVVLQKDIQPKLMSVDTPIQQTYLTKRRLTTLNSLQSGNMGGINQVNYQCQRQAMKANVFGIFRALLDLSTIMSTPNQKLTIVNLMNQTLTSLNDATFHSDSATGRLSAPVYSFGGRMIIPVSRGSRLSWMSTGSLETTCHGWTSSSSKDTGSVFNISSSGLSPSPEEQPTNQPCNSTNVVFCIEILPLDKTHLRHFRNPSSNKKNGAHHNKPRLNFEKYLSILRNYDSSSKDQLSAS